MLVHRVAIGRVVFTFGGTTPVRWAMQFKTTDTKPEAPRLWPKAPLCE